MSLKNRIVKAGAGLALAGVIASVHTYEAEAASWQPRTVSEIQSDIQAQADGQEGTVEYTFQWGDSLWGISQATGIPTNKLAQVNNIENSGLIMVGNSIYLSENGSVLTVEDENHQVKSYDVSEEAVKETETPEEVKEQAEQGQTSEEKQEAKEAAVQIVESQDQNAEEVDIEEENSQEVGEDSAVEGNTGQADNEVETVQEVTDETEGRVEDVNDSDLNEENDSELETAGPTASDNQTDQSESNDNSNDSETDVVPTESNNSDVNETSSNEEAATNSGVTEVLGANTFSTPTPDPEPQQSELASTNVLAIGESVIGTPYAYGGTTPAGFDCSGFIQWVFAQAGKSVPRTTNAQYAAATPVSNPQPGDIVFFSDGNGGVQHTGIYAGNGQFLGAQSSTGVAYTSVNGPYWGPKLMGYGRL